MSNRLDRSRGRQQRSKRTRPRAPSIPMPETKTEGGKKTVSIPISETESRMLKNARTILHAAQAKLSAAIKAARGEYEVAVAQHHEDMRYVIDAYDVEPPDGASVGCDYEKHCITWEITDDDGQSADETPSQPSGHPAGAGQDSSAQKSGLEKGAPEGEGAKGEPEGRGEGSEEGDGCGLQQSSGSNGGA